MMLTGLGSPPESWAVSAELASRDAHSFLRRRLWSIGHFGWPSSLCWTNTCLGFPSPGTSLVAQMAKNPSVMQDTQDSIPGSGGFPWRRKWQPIPVFLFGKPHGPRSLAGYSLWGCKELDTTELTFSPHLLVLQSLGPGAKAALKAKVEIRSPRRCFPAPAVGQKEATALPLPPCLPWALQGLAGHTRFRRRRLKIGP